MTRSDLVEELAARFSQLTHRDAEFAVKTILDAMSDADAADMISGVPGTKGGNQGWQKVRTKHHRRLDTSVGALSVFWEATDITDHWYYTQDITADFRGLLRRREVAESLVAISRQVGYDRGRVSVDMPPAAHAMFESRGNSAGLFQVRGLKNSTGKS